MAFLLAAAALTSSGCAGLRTWYRQNQELGAVESVRSDLRSFEEKYNNQPLVLDGTLQPCKWNYDQPLPEIQATERGRYHPFERPDGRIEYPEGEYIVLEHEVQHFMNWMAPAPWRCLDELTAYLRQRYKTEQRAKIRLQRELRMRR